MKTPERQISIIGQSPSFQPTGDTSQFFNELSGSLEATARDMQAKADIIYTNEFMTSAREEARNIYERNINNPDQLKNELNEYKQGLLNNVPASLRPKLDLNYNSMGATYINNAFINKNKMLTEQQNAQLAKSENRIIDDIKFSVSNFFNNQGLDENQVVAKNITTFDAIAASSDELEKNLLQVNEQGLQIRTPEQVQKSLVNLQQTVFSEISKSWFSSQPDKLKAYSEWLNNEAVVNLPDETINIRESLSPDVRKKIDQDILSEIKNEVYIDKQLEERFEAEEAIFTDELKKQLYDQSKTGDLLPATVEAARNILDYNDYQNFSKMAIQANPTTNGFVYGNFVNRINKGENVLEEIRSARFDNKSLSNEDFESLLNKIDGNEVFVAPEKEAVNNLRGLLGATSELLDVVDSQIIQSAEMDLKKQLRLFNQTNDRSPTYEEAEKITNKVFEEYNIINLKNFAATFPKPELMTYEQKTNAQSLTLQDIKDIRKNTNLRYQKKYNDNDELTKRDPDFQRENEKINKWREFIINKSK